MEPTIDTAAHVMTFVSPAFLLGMSVLALIALLAILIYRATARTGSGDVLRKFMEPGFVIAMTCLFLAGMALWIAVYGPLPVSAETLSLIFGAVIIGTMTDVRKSYMPTSRDAEQKNDTIQTQAKAIAANGTGSGGNDASQKP